jgi:predicted MFS family arabinose efflux permease
MALTAARANQARNAITAIFAIQGVVGVTQIPRIPELIEQVGADFGIWGLITGLAGLGGMLGLLFTSKLIAVFGTKNVTIVGGSVQALFTVALIFAHDPMAYLIFTALGALSGSTLNISINSQSVALQKAMNRVIIGRFHASWSIGATASAVLSGILATFMPLWLHLLIVPTIGIFALIILGRNLLRSEEDGHGSGQPSAKKSSFFKMPNQVWLLSAGLFTGIFGELALMDWSAVYSKTVLSLDAGRGAIPYAAFSLAMIIGRLSINKLGNKWHISSVARVASMLAGVSLGLGVLFGAVIAPTNQELALVIVSVFFFFTGLGSAPMVPSFFSAAGYVKGLNTAQVLARMSFMNSVAIIGAKYLMGVLALNVGLAMAFAFPMVLFFIAGILAGMVAKRAKASETMASAYPTTGAMSITED